MTITKDQAIAAADVIDAEYPTYTREGRVDSAVLTLRQFIEQSVSPPGAPAQAVQQPNQCDGCARGLSVDESGLHRGPGRWDVQACTADRYPAAGDPGQDSRGSGETESGSSGSGEASVPVGVHSGNAPANAPRAEDSAWQPIETAPKDGRTILLGFMEDGEITQTAEMQWGHVQRNALFPGAVGMWVCPGANFTWNPEPAEFGPSHWQEARSSKEQGAPTVNPIPTGRGQMKKDTP